jgi:hypothetical protein
MPAVFERRVSRSAIGSRRLGAYALVLMLTASLAHRYGLIETPVFAIVFAVVTAAAALALMLSVRAFSSLWTDGDLGGGNLVAGAFSALLAVSPLAPAGYLLATRPWLHDVTTDGEDPPEMSAAARHRTTSMNDLHAPGPAALTLQRKTYPGVVGRSYQQPFERVRDAVAALVVRNGWRAGSLTPEADAAEETIEAEARTPLFGFVADVAIRVRDEDGTTAVDMRSAWRYGPSDMGDNAARIAGFLADLDADLGVAPPAAP